VGQIDFFDQAGVIHDTSPGGGVGLLVKPVDGVDFAEMSSSGLELS